MEINIQLLEKYCKKNGYACTINIDISSNEALLILIAGENPEGSRREFIEFKDCYNILLKNNIIGTDSKVAKELAALEDGPNRTLPIENIEKYIYGTLSTYIIQLLLASTGRVHYKDLLPLEKHTMHFTER